MLTTYQPKQAHPQHHPFTNALIAPIDSHVLAASSATQKELAKAKDKHKDGSKPIITEKRPYQPPQKSLYVEPEDDPAELEPLDILLEQQGKVLCRQHNNLPPRTDIIEFQPIRDQQEFDDSIQWADCPTHMKPRIEKLIKKYWDVFTKEGLKNSIRGFKFHIDTGAVQPVSCRTPPYGPHESRIILKLAEALELNGIIEDGAGPWGALVVLAAKPHQEHKHWSEYVWRLCVSYRALNAVTRPFAYPTRRCDDQ